MVNRNRLFAASCVALVTTSMVFSIRADILDALGADFWLTRQQTGVLLSPAFWGFTLSILIGGSLVDFFGMRRLLVLSSLGYVAAILMILLAPRPMHPVDPYYRDSGFLVLYAGMLTLGLSQGLVEGVINPLCSTLYPLEKTRRMNILHAWWPGGLILGGFTAVAITRVLDLGTIGPLSGFEALGWKVKLLPVLLMAMAYLVLIMGQEFPVTERVSAGVTSREMFRESVRPMFLLLWCCMWMTAATEIGPDQWVGSLITNLTGMQGVLILVYTASIMFVLRFFGGRVADHFSPMGVMTLSAILSAWGLFSLGAAQTSAQAFAAATLFGVGKAFFWPMMLGMTAELFPRGGAFLLAIMGGTGQLAAACVLPLMGRWYDTDGASAAFVYVATLPVILTVVFAVLYLYYRMRGGYRAILLDSVEPKQA